jgi:ABC-type Fe3+-siderophore transport system permease subunit
VLIGGRLAETAATLRTVGSLLGVPERAEALARYAETVVGAVHEGVAKIPSAKRPSVYVARGPRGLETAVAGSIGSEVVDLVGARNVVDKDTGPRAIVDVSPEQVLAWQPDVILTVDRRFYAAVHSDPVWREVRAVQAGHIHFVPDLPFSWFDNPPAANRLIGLLWLGKLLYLASFPQDIRAEARRFMPFSINRNRASLSSTGFLPIPRREPSAAFGYRALIVGAALTLLLLVAAATALGPYRVAPGELLAFLIAKVTGATSPLSAPAEAVILQIRLPRVFAATAVGAALAAAGAAYQSLFPNPLVSPDILGVSSGSAFGAVVGIYLSLPVLAIEAASFAGGLAAVIIVYAIAAAIRGRDAVLVLVLAGVVIGALFGAGVGLLKYLADPYNQLPAITFWLLGSLAAANLRDLTSLLPAVIVGLVPLALLRWRIDVMTLGDEEATNGAIIGHAHAITPKFLANRRR